MFRALVEVTLQPIAPETPASPGRHVLRLHLYKMIAPGDKARTVHAQELRLVDRRQGLWPEPRQIGDVKLDALAAGLLAVRDISTKAAASSAVAISG
jgi:hypothetical protein